MYSYQNEITSGVSLLRFDDKRIGRILVLVALNHSLALCAPPHPPCHKNQTLHPVRLRKSTHLWRDWTCETFDKNVNFVTNLSKQDIFCWNHCRRGNSYRIRILILISLKTLKNMHKGPNSWNLRTAEPKKIMALTKNMYIMYKPLKAKMD